MAVKVDLFFLMLATSSLDKTVVYFSCVDERLKLQALVDSGLRGNRGIATVHFRPDVVLIYVLFRVQRELRICNRRFSS